MARMTKSTAMIPVMTAFLALGFCSCGGAPTKPAHLPFGAAWGGEGGTGVFLKVDSHQGTLWQMQVWDRKGQLLSPGPFRLRGFAKAQIVPEEVRAWENGVLHLKDGTVLVPETPAAR